MKADTGTVVISFYHVFFCMYCRSNLLLKRGMKSRWKRDKLNRSKAMNNCHLGKRYILTGRFELLLSHPVISRIQLSVSGQDTGEHMLNGMFGVSCVMYTIHVHENVILFCL